MHANAEAVVGAGRLQGVELTVSEFPEGTRTAADAAAAIGVDVGQIVKSLVFVMDDQVVVALVSGPKRLDEARLAAVAGGGPVRRASADEVRDATGYPIGGVPPFAHRTPLPTFVDRSLLDYDVVWSAAGTPRHVFPLPPPTLVRLTAGKLADITG